MFFRGKVSVLLVVLLSLCLLCTGQALAAKKWKLGHVALPDAENSYHATALKFKELLADKTDIKVTVFPQLQLGDDREMLEGVPTGLLEVTAATLGPISAFEPKVGLLELPFLFNNLDHLDAVLDGPIGRELLDGLEKAGYKGLGFFDDGINNITNSKRPIHSAADFRGLQMRTIEAPVRIAVAKSLGANPVPVAYSELYTALQTGVVDGQSNPNWVISSRSLWEVQKYVSVTNHIWGGAALVMNLEKFNALSPEEQQIVLAAGQEACRHGRKMGRDAEAMHLQKAIDHGMTVDQNPDLGSMRKATASVYDDIYRDQPAWKPAIEEIRQLGKKF
jgi:tripartite ATP-independent transporter DctP family solute receptor